MKVLVYPVLILNSDENIEILHLPFVNINKTTVHLDKTTFLVINNISQML